MRQRIAQIAGNRANGTRRTRRRRAAGQNSGGTRNAAAAPAIDGILNSVRRTGRCVIENIRKQLVVKDAVTGANHGFVVSEKAAQEAGCIGEAYPWGKIVFVPLLGARKDSGEIAGATQANAEPGVDRGKLQRVFERALIFVT